MSEVKYTFISFVENPGSGKNLGCCVVECVGASAIFVARSKGINPGGEAAMFGLSQSEFEEQGLELDRLYTKKEMNEKDFEKL